MVRADKDCSPFAAGLADPPAHGGGSLHLQVHVLGAGLNGPFQDIGSLRLFAEAAGGNKRYVGLGEQQIHVLVLQGAAVQADLGHLEAGKKVQDLGQFLILY